MSVHVVGLFGAVIASSLLALIHFKWISLHPEIIQEDDKIIIKDSLYYGSIPHIEKTIHKALSENEKVTIDITQTTYIDHEGCRWLKEIESNKNLILIRG